jgi:hypothetical protein
LDFGGRTSYEQQVQPSVPAPGAPAAEQGQGRVGVEGWSKSKIGQQKFCFKKCAPDFTFEQNPNQNRSPFFFMYNAYWEHFRPVEAPCTRDVFGGHLR